MLVFCVTSHAANNFASKKTLTPISLQKPSNQITVGEKVSYEVSWMGVPVGIGELEVREKTVLDGREVFHVVATAKTNEVLSKIYPVHDEAHSWIDAETFYSHKFRKILSEGRYRADEETRFDPKNKKGYYESYKNGTKKEFEIAGEVHDIMSAFFWCRRQMVPPGKSVHTTVSSEEKDWDLELKALSLETKEIRGVGTVDTILYEPKTKLKGMLYQRGRVWVYMTTDSRRLPVWIVFKTPFGPVTGVLQKSPASSG